MSRKKIAIIGTVGLPACYGGFETLTDHLVEGMNERFQVSVYCSGKKYPKAQRKSHYKGARLFFLPFKANGIQSILYDCISILHALFYADVLLILGVSGGILLPFVKLFTRKKIIVSIDGIEWKRNKWSKAARLYLWVAEWLAVKFSHADIADNESIQNYTAIRYKTLSNIIEYGANHAKRETATAEDREKYPFLKKIYALKVCRIEPENNIHVVLQAFSQLSNYHIVIVGNWNNSDYGRDLRTQYEIFPNITLLDPIYDQRMLDVIRSCSFVYIHGHSAGGTNPSLVEAMFLGLPVISFDVSYNRTTTEEKALFFKNADDLIQTVRNARLPVLQQVAANMKNIADRRYTWQVIAQRYEYLVNQVLRSKGKVALASSLSQDLRRSQLLQWEVAHFQTPTYFYEKN